MSWDENEGLGQKLTYGCEDKHDQGEKCSNCIYNIKGIEQINCIFRESN